ncbi:hypothetical protein EUX98_g7213 [Antrodiella citrinella]|uniref:HMG box domain-containing protein n=1 Tax=Antrodiella citrinella TaxID=2447956 RepID=A0A4S4MM39_9APHY|nr:hypothetical protein EUX98_g7213 [Antrodiella citrinella]
MRERFGRGSTIMYAQEAGELWTAMSAHEKKPYFDRARLALQEYKRLREEYCNTYNITWPRQPASALSLFGRERKMRVQEAYSLWEQLSEAERQPYVDKRNALSEEYRVRKLEYALHLQKDTLNNVVPKKGEAKLLAVQKRAKKVRLSREHEQVVDAGHIEVPTYDTSSAWKIFRLERKLSVTQASAEWRRMTAEEKKVPVSRRMRDEESATSS